ncbi:MAG TPA: PQQ-dependent sugar dehydrogenase [Fibrobacteria bacterium]|nr:PQQ-dependent sugar dehydrogenase [Fibrobacteria bacterium]
MFTRTGTARLSACSLGGCPRGLAGTFRKTACLALGLATLAKAQWTYPGCNPVTDTDFKYELMLKRGAAPDAELDEPLKMAFDKDATGKVDIYYVERKGKLKRYLAATGQVQTLGTLNVWKGPYTKTGGQVEEGLIGIALDPAFKANGQIYVMYSPATESVFRISRFTLAGAALNPASEKVILDIPAQREDCCHTGGAMQFDAYGDLWIGVGNNTGRSGSPLQLDETRKYGSDEWGSSSTAGLRGSILRIHPDESAKGYSIPRGNFWEYFADEADKANKAAVAADYRDSSKVKREIYVKGVRNPYSLTLDPVRRWVMFGDVGPDKSGLISEENNLFKHPVFAGWPYFCGNNTSYVGSKDPLAPANTSKWNLGLKTLPPATPAIHSYLKSSVTTGPIYRYDGDLAAAGKLPPHFDRKWFVTDFNSSKVKLLSLDDAGDKVLKEEDIFKNAHFARPLDFQQGPDGALYVINYAGWFNSNSETSIARITYTGTCRPAIPNTVEEGAVARRTAPASPWLLNFGPALRVKVPAGMNGFRLHDAAGRILAERHGLRGVPETVLPNGLPRGMLKIRWVQE